MGKKSNRWLIILVVVLILLILIVVANSTPLIKMFNNSPKASTLDVITNPENYLNQNISLQNVFITFQIYDPFTGSEGYMIATTRGDGNWVYLPISYSDSIVCTHYDLEGMVKKTSKGYFFEATRAICLK